MHWPRQYRLLQKPVEQLSSVLRCSSVEPEGELVEVVAEVLVTDCALVGAQDPALQKGSDSMYSRHQLMRFPRLPLQDGDLVLVPPDVLEPVVAFPAIGVDDSSRLDVINRESVEAVHGCVRDVLKPDASDPLAVFLGGHRDERLPLGLPAGHALFQPSEIRFVHLHGSSEAFTTRPNHCAAQSVQQRPSSHVSFQPQDPLQAQGTRPVLLARDVPDGSEPESKGHPGVLEDGSGCHGGLVMAPGALQTDAPDTPSPTVIALRTSEAVRPSQADEVLAAGLLGREARFELHEVSRVVFHAWGGYQAAQPESTRYPFGVIPDFHFWTSSARIAIYENSPDDSYY